MSSKRGFTLVELLVVVTILGVLGSIGFASFRGTQGKARDTARKTDLRQLGVALEIYYQSNGSYVTTTSAQCDLTNNSVPFYNAIALFMQNSNPPEDPLTGEQYCYYSEGANGKSFRLFAKLENCSDPEVYNPATCSSDPYNFSVASPDLQIASAQVPTPTPGPTSTPSPTPPSPPCPTSGLIAYWKMDESSWSGTAGEVIDSSGNGNNGSSRNGTTITTLGKFANAGSFDGVDDYITVPNSASLNPANVTAAMWVNFNGPLSVDKAFLAKGTSFLDRSYWFYENGGIQFGSGGNISSQIPSSSFSPGQWYHIAGTLDGSNLRIYLNAVPQGSPVPAGPASFSAPVGINAYGNGNYVASSKAIDDVRIYNQALTATEIATLQNCTP